jgi:exodeoxyribonuclease-3
MRILTWNVNSIRACFEKDGAYRLSDLNCDVLCFQETKCHEDQFNSDLLKDYKGFWSNGRRKGYSGVATYSKVQTQLISSGIGIRRYDFEGRVVVCDLKEFLLYNIYFPNGGASQERHQFKQEFLSDLNNHLQDVLNSGREIVLVGDYNVAPEAVDVYDPEALKGESGFLPEERDWFKSLLGLGFVDAFRKVNPEATDKYTWWSYKDNARVKNRGWRIDHICVSTGLSKRVVAAEVRDDLHGSDHCPVLVELK